eukprot:GHVL01016543.1.p1 GENE.GHVL01016543.1~~GHVL01016543.1.p1  ORF type:complete len:560 (-),score=77.34 GHVL01016543.1:279-1958(-)
MTDPIIEQTLLNHINGQQKSHFPDLLWTNEYENLETNSNKKEICTNVENILINRNAKVMIVGNQPNIKREGVPMTSLCDGKIIFANTGASRWFGKNVNGPNTNFVDEPGRPGFLEFPASYHTKPEKPLVSWKDQMLRIKDLTTDKPFDLTGNDPAIVSMRESDKIIILASMRGDHGTFVQIMREAVKGVTGKVYIIAMGSFTGFYAGRSISLLNNFAIDGQFFEQFGVEADIEIIVGKNEYGHFMNANRDPAQLSAKQLKARGEEPQYIGPNGLFYEYFQNRILSYRRLGELLMVVEGWTDPDQQGTNREPNRYLQEIMFSGARRLPISNRSDHNQFEDKLRKIPRSIDCDDARRVLQRFEAKKMISESSLCLTKSVGFKMCDGDLIKLGAAIQDPYVVKSLRYPNTAAEWIEITDFKNNKIPKMFIKNITTARKTAKLGGDPVLDDPGDEVYSADFKNDAEPPLGAGGGFTIPAPKRASRAGPTGGPKAASRAGPTGAPRGASRAGPTGGPKGASRTGSTGAPKGASQAGPTGAPNSSFSGRLQRCRHYDLCEWRHDE